MPIQLRMHLESILFAETDSAQPSLMSAIMDIISIIIQRTRWR
jgi:hypothetical protein